MTRRYLLDTNAISHMMIDADGIVAKRAERALTGSESAELCTSVIVQCELAFGLKKRPSARLQAALNAQLAGLIVLPLDEAVVLYYASLRAELETRGTPIGPNDTLIAAHALALDATLVSADAEFLRVPGLRVENWLVQADA